MNNQDNGGTAFPQHHAIAQKHDNGGMTLLDYFAAHAPEPPPLWHGGERSVADIIEWRWVYAAAMLKARK